MVAGRPDPRERRQDAAYTRDVTEAIMVRHEVGDSVDAELRDVLDRLYAALCPRVLAGVEEHRVDVRHDEHGPVAWAGVYELQFEFPTLLSGKPAGKKERNGKTAH